MAGMRTGKVRRARLAAVVVATLLAGSLLGPGLAPGVAQTPPPPDEPGRPTERNWTDAPFTDELITSGLAQSLSADFLPDGRLLVLGKRGTVTLVDVATGAKSEVVSIPAVNTEGERGALDLVVSPSFNADRHFFVYYSGTDFRMHVDRFTLGTPSETSASRTRIWSNPGALINQTSTSHLGGSLNFGPDAMLYVSIGDTNQAPNSQDLRNVFGKVLRIRSDGTVPPGNPFADGSGPNVDEIWAYGFRNPFRASFDPATGYLWLGDVGGNYHKNAYEEINVVVAGANHGWPLCEGPVDLPKNGAVCPAGVTGPVSFYSHDLDLRTGENASITGGEVYHGGRYGSLEGAYVYADYARHQIRFATLATPSTVATDGLVMSTGELQPTWIGAAPDGALYYVHFGYSGSTGEVHRLEWSGSSSRPPVIGSASASPLTGATPLTVTFNGSASDPDGTPVTYRWDFGDGASAEGASQTHTYTTAGRYEAQLHVSSNGQEVRSAILVVQAGTAPTATITSPANGTTFKAGDVVTLTGSGSDDEPLPERALRWDVAFVHDEHTHPVMEDVAGSRLTLPIPTTGHGYEGRTGYQVTLRVLDADGLGASTSIRLVPRKVAVQVASNLPPGSGVVIDGINQVLPFTIDALEAFQLPVEVPATVCAAGHQWRFARWSTGAPRSFTLTVPAADATITASYDDAGPNVACGTTSPRPAGAVVAGAPAPGGGMWVAYSGGSVVGVGHVAAFGDVGMLPLNAPLVGMAATRSGGGYWLLGGDGGVFSFGDAVFHGSTGGMRLNQPVVAMAADPAGHGYWTVATDGGVFSFGVPFHGSTGGLRLNQPVVGMAPTASGAGYWLVARDGGVFSFGDARFHGSTGGLRLNQPVVGMVADPDGRGYWLVAADGGIFAFDAAFRGSAVGRLAAGDGVVSAVATGDGYALVTAGGAVFDFS